MLVQVQQSVIPPQQAAIPQTDLKKMVSKLISNSLSTAVERNSFIVNDVPDAIGIETNENMLAAVIGSMLHMIVCNTDNSCIRVEASKNGESIMVQFSDNGNVTGYYIAQLMEEVQPLAQWIGGYITVASATDRMKIIALSFPGQIRAAC